MIRSLKTALLLAAAALPAFAWQAPVTSPAYHRVDLKHFERLEPAVHGRDPGRLEVREDKAYPGFWLGPADVQDPVRFTARVGAGQPDVASGP